MKTALKTLVFVLISLRFSQDILPCFSYGSNANSTFLLVMLALTFLCILLPPILKILGLPSKRPGFFIFLFILSSIVIYICTVFIPDFSLRSAQITNLIIFGFMLPFKSFSPLSGGIMAAFIFSATYVTLGWLGSKK